jgi:hypothetical protein
VIAAGPLAVSRPHRRLGDDQVGRQPWIVYRVMRTNEAVTGAERNPQSDI